MIHDQADLASIQKLREFAERLSVRRREVDRVVDGACGKARQMLSRLKASLADAQSRYDAAESALAEVDENQRDDLEDNAESCRQYCAELESAISVLEGALVQFESMARALGAASGNTFSAAEAFLRGRLAAVDDYVTMRPSVGTVDDLQAGGGARPPRKSSGAIGTIDLSGAPLPSGFQWVSIDALNCELPVDPAEWKKGVSKDQMCKSLEVFRLDVLPRLSVSRDMGYDSFFDLDRRSGRTTSFGFVHPRSMANIFSVLFGQSPIVVNRSGTDSTIVDGRHRIAAAREIGWTHIPAKII